MKLHDLMGFNTEQLRSVLPRFVEGKKKEMKGKPYWLCVRTEETMQNYKPHFRVVAYYTNYDGILPFVDTGRDGKQADNEEEAKRAALFYIASMLFDKNYVLDFKIGANDEK